MNDDGEKKMQRQKQRRQRRVLNDEHRRRARLMLDKATRQCPNAAVSSVLLALRVTKWTQTDRGRIIHRSTWYRHPLLRRPIISRVSHATNGRFLHGVVDRRLTIEGVEFQLRAAAAAAAGAADSSALAYINGVVVPSPKAAWLDVSDVEGLFAIFRLPLTVDTLRFLDVLMGGMGGKLVGALAPHVRRYQRQLRQRLEAFMDALDAVGVYKDVACVAMEYVCSEPFAALGYHISQSRAKRLEAERQEQELRRLVANQRLRRAASLAEVVESLDSDDDDDDDDGVEECCEDGEQDEAVRRAAMRQLARLRRSHSVQVNRSSAKARYLEQFDDNL